MFIDDLPMWGYIGEVVHEEFLLGKSIQGARVILYPHLHFSIGFNNDQIVTANVTTDTKRGVDITDASVAQEVRCCSRLSLSLSLSPCFSPCTTLTLDPLFPLLFSSP